MDWITAFTEFLSHKDVGGKIRPPASSESIAAIEERLAKQQRIRGFQMPPSYKVFLEHWGGGWVDDAPGGTHVWFLSVAEDATTCTSLMDYNGEDTVLMNHEIETYFTFEPLVMIAMDEGSNFWAFDPRLTQSDGEMPVRFCDHETGDIYEQAADFPSFIMAIANRTLDYRGLENPIIRGI